MPPGEILGSSATSSTLRKMDLFSFFHSLWRSQVFERNASFVQPKIRDVLKVQEGGFSLRKKSHGFSMDSGCRHDLKVWHNSEGNYLSSFPKEKRDMASWSHALHGGRFLLWKVHPVEEAPPCSISCRRDRLEAPFSPLETKYSLKLVETTTKNWEQSKYQNGKISKKPIRIQRSNIRFSCWGMLDLEFFHHSQFCFGTISQQSLGQQELGKGLKDSFWNPCSKWSVIHLHRSMGFLLPTTPALMPYGKYKVGNHTI